MEKTVQVQDLTFKWGKKRETNVETKKDVQFYESFIYGDSEFCLYDCVSFYSDTNPDSSQFFVGKIINMWEYNDQRQHPRRIQLLWFFKPSEISLYLKGVQDVRPNELFLASGTGIGLTNENRLEAIHGKCSVICTSKDLRNPQPSEEDIKSAEFLFHRTFDVGTCKILDKIRDKIAGVDVKFIFNRTNCEKKARDVQKVASNIHGTADNLKPNLPSTSGSVRQNERKALDLSGHRKSEYGAKKKEDDEYHKQLASKKFTRREERSNKDYGRRDGELDCYNASDSRRNDCHVKKDQENDVRRHMTKQKSRLAEERSSKDSYCLNDLPQKKRKLHGGYVAASDGRTTMSQKISPDGRKDLRPVRKDMMVEKSSKDSYCLDDMPPKKDDVVTVSDGRTTNSQKVNHDSRKGIVTIRNPKEKVSAGGAYSKQPCFSDKKQDLRIPKFSGGKETKPATEKGLLEKPNIDCKKSRRTEGNTSTNANYRRHYQVFEVTRKPPEAEESKWYRSLPWEENLKCAEGQENLVLLQNLDPAYTSSEVEDIVYSSLNEQCTARMIERTPTTIPHIGEALVIFKTVDAAKRVIRRLDEGCLLLPNGRPLVASIAKVNPSGKPPSRFIGHIKTRNQKRRGMRDAVATSHASQANTIEYDMAMEWRLHRDRFELTWERIFEQQIEEKKQLRRISSQDLLLSFSIISCCSEKF